MTKDYDVVMGDSKCILTFIKLNLILIKIHANTLPIFSIPPAVLEI